MSTETPHEQQTIEELAARLAKAEAKLARAEECIELLRHENDPFEQERIYREHWKSPDQFQ